MRTFTCVAVDDEKLIMERLERFFRNLSGQGAKYKLVGTAASAREGMELIIDKRPDIVITDIVMPEMNGIEMIGSLKKRLPGTVFIILSAYADFHYAKEAIAMNVLDYIVKAPLRESKLLEALEKASRKLTDSRERDMRFYELNVNARSNIQHLRRLALDELLQGELRPGELERRNGELMLQFRPQAFCCFMIQLDDFRSFQQRYSSSDQKTLRYAVLNIAEELLSQHGEGFACERGQGRFAGFVSWHSMMRTSAIEEVCLEVGQQMVRNIQLYLKETVSVSFSPAAHGWNAAVEAYKQAESALEEVFFSGRGSVITPQRRRNTDPGVMNELEELLKQMSQSLSPELPPAAADHYIARFKKIVETGRIPKSVLLSLTARAMDEWTRKSAAWRQPVIQEPKGPPYDWYELLAITEEAWLAARTIAGLAQKLEVVKARTFIEQHLEDRLSLQQVAEYVNMNASYFSVLFKKETGEGLTDFINRKRIERAIMLLSTRDYSNQDLGDAVGIPNERYFCTLFKKITGTSPQRYRKK